jgi:hypothetical protein
MGDMAAAIADAAAIAQRVDARQAFEHDAALRGCAAGATPVAAQRVLGEIRRGIVGDGGSGNGKAAKGDDECCAHGMLSGVIH